MSIIVKEGFVIIKIALGFAAACYVIGKHFNVPLLIIMSILAFVFALFACFFFRNPSRTINANESEIISPADGTVMEIVPEKNDVLGTNVIVVRIFLSVFNVHVQRAPITGTVTNVTYTKGKFLAAMNPRAHIENEQNAVMITAPDGKKIICTQIAGLIARRIVMWKKQGDIVKKGDLYGMIKFGSQVDISMPIDTHILVKPKQKVRAGTTIIAQWKKT